MNSLRTQTLTYLLLLLATVGVASYVSSAWLMDKSLQEYEHKVANERLARVNQGLELSLSALKSSVTDYARWDDSYEFMQQPNQDYLDANYTTSSLGNLNVDMALFLKPDGKLQSVVEAATGKSELFSVQNTKFDPLLQGFLSNANVLKSKSGVMLLLFEGNPIALAYASIETSDANLDSADVGWLIMGKVLDEKGLQSLSQLTGAKITLTNSPPSAINPSTLGKHQQLSQPLKNSLDATPIYLIVDAPPRLESQRNTSQKLLLVNALIMVVLTSLAVAILLERLILRRLAFFSSLATQQQAVSQKNAPKWPVTGHDELDVLAQSLNRMLEGLNDAEAKLRADQISLLDAKEKLEIANRLKDSFLATISHELRTPMNGIIGILELLKATPLNSYQKECMGTLSESSMQMLSMVERILLFSELQSGLVRLKPQRLNLPEWASQIQNTWSGVFKNKNIAFTTKADLFDDPWVSVDAVKLNQFVQELLWNAEKFTPQGSVTLLLQQIKEDEKLFLVVDITDTGIGIPTVQQTTIIEPFRQLQDKHNRTYGGLGIGLSITKAIISHLGGKWTIESEVGKGTHIHVAIPVNKAPQASNKQEVALLSPDITPEVTAARILLVEDNPVNQKMMEKILEFSGWDYSVAKNGEEAVNQARNEKFMLILMDYQMPIMDGLEATKIIRSSPNQNQDTPIIGITANAMEQDYENCIAIGMNDYYTKPIKPQQINHIILQWTGRKSKRSAVD
jgi:two-component system, sensor histidine kinase